MKRRIQEPNCNRISFHRLIQLLEISSLQRKYLIKCFFSLFQRIGTDHLAECINPVALKKHMLCTTQADSLCSQLSCFLCVCRSIRVGSYFQRPVFVRPFHNSLKFTGDRSIHCFDFTVINITGSTVKGYHISFMILFSCQRKFLICLIHIDGRTARYAACSHSSCYNCRMTRHTASYGQDTLCHLHAFDIFRRSFQTYQHDFLASCRPCFCIFCRKHDFSASCTRRCCQCFCNRFCTLESIRIELRMQQRIQISRVNHRDCLLFGNHPFIYQITGNLQSCLRRSLTAAGLQHIQMLVFNGKFHILHVSVMVLQRVADSHKLLKYFRHHIFQMGNRLRRTYTCHYILSLGVQKKLTHQFLLSRGRIPGKCHTCS